MATHSNPARPVQTTIDFGRATGQSNKRRKVAPVKEPIFKKPTNAEEMRGASKALQLYVMEKNFASSDCSVIVCEDSLRHCFDALAVCDSPCFSRLCRRSWRSRPIASSSLAFNRGITFQMYMAVMLSHAQQNLVNCFQLSIT